jgi:hypothetical protein
MKFKEQWETSIHCNSAITLITQFTECLPFCICTNTMKLTTLVKYMFPQRGSDLLLTERAGSWCLFCFSTLMQIEKIYKKIN